MTEELLKPRLIYLHEFFKTLPLYPSKGGICVGDFFLQDSLKEGDSFLFIKKFHPYVAIMMKEEIQIGMRLDSLKDVDKILNDTLEELRITLIKEINNAGRNI
jgi:hypothetical protein